MTRIIWAQYSLTLIASPSFSIGVVCQLFETLNCYEWHSHRTIYSEHLAANKNETQVYIYTLYTFILYLKLRIQIYKFQTLIYSLDITKSLLITSGKFVDVFFYAVNSWAKICTVSNGMLPGILLRAKAQRCKGCVLIECHISGTALNSIQANFSQKSQQSSTLSIIPLSGNNDIRKSLYST